MLTAGTVKRGAISRPAAPVVRPSEPLVHQWGYEGIKSEIVPTLKPKPQNWGYGATAVVFLSLISAGVMILQGHTGLAVLAGLIAVILVGIIAVLGIRQRERFALADRAAEDIAPLVSTYLTRRCIRVRRWTAGWWVGHPALIVVRYAQGAADNPTLKQDLTDRLSDRFGVRYELKRDVPRKRLFEFVVAPPTQEEAPLEEDPLTKRVNSVVTKLFSAPNANPPQIDLTWEGDTLAQIHVSHDIGYNLTSAMVRKDKAHKLSVMIPGRWKVSWNTEADSGTFTLRPDLPIRIPHPPIPPMVGTPQENYQSEYRYGVDESGEHMAWRPWLDPMMMIVGKTGRGKTVVAHSVLTELTARGWLVDVSDAKLIEFIGYKDWPNVRCVGAVLEEQVRLVHAAMTLMQDRYQQIVEGVASEEDFHPYCLFLDEYALFREDLADWYVDIKRQGDPAKVPTSRKVNAVLRAGRTARVHIVLLTQRPDAEVLGSGEPRLNLSCRVSMGALDMDGARMMWGSPSVGIAVPTNIRGRGVTRNEAGDVVDFQGYWTPDPRKNKTPEDLAILEGLYPAQDLHEKLRIIQPHPILSDKDDGEMLLPSYNEFAEARMVPADQVDHVDELEDTEGDIPSLPSAGSPEVNGSLPHAVTPAREDADSSGTAPGGRLTPEQPVLNLVRHGSSIDGGPQTEQGDGDADVEGVVGGARPAVQEPRDLPPAGRPRQDRDDRINRRLEEEATDAISDQSRDFDPETPIGIESITAGYRVLLDEEAGIWAAVSDSMQDEAEDNSWVLSCVTDDGQYETFVAEIGETMIAQAPTLREG